MEKDNQMDKLEYEEPKIVDLQIEQKNTQGIPAIDCTGGTSATGNCGPGGIPG